MQRSQLKTLFWIVLALLVFTLFRWLFGMAMPEIALPFSIGITTLLISGLMAGRGISRIWFKAAISTQNRVVSLMSVALFSAVVGIGFLLNVMMSDTKIHHFIFTILLLFISSGCMGILVSLLRNRSKKELRDAKLAQAQSDSELKLLQAQLSPHFLFNTLNNLYGLSLSNHEKVPELLLKLSELLRYSVYEAKEPFVPLRDELDYIRNYIEFERIRLGNRLNLSVSIEEVPDVKIPPMLLIVFVENAFKHSKNSQDEKIFVEIELAPKPSGLTFSVKNTFSKSEKTTVMSKHSGFGLSSVKKRLDLLYPGKYTLDLNSEKNLFKVNLLLITT